MGVLQRSAKAVVVLNLIAFAIGGLGLLADGDFQRWFFLAMLTEAGFILISAGLEDIRMTPTGTQIRRALFKQGAPYSAARHKEAQGTANVMVGVGGIVLAEAVGISLAFVILHVPGV